VIRWDLCNTKRVKEITSQMTVTLTANYKEVLNAVTVEKIDELLDEKYALDDMLVFIDEYNENDFVAYYEEYVRVGEAIGFEAVDALIGEMGCLSDIEDCDERYQGCLMMRQSLLNNS
jgi:hypothetical protein